MALLEAGPPPQLQDQVPPGRPPHDLLLRLMPTDREIDEAVDRYIELMERGEIIAARRAEEYAAHLIEQKHFEDDGL